jgi:predicted phosphodiesterase
MENAKFVAASCFHAPHNPEAPFEWLLGRLSDLNPTHFILLGDLFDASSVSVHPNDHVEKLEYEYEKASILLSRIHDVLPNAELIWTLGNHDDNIQTGDPRRTPKALRSLLHWNKHWEWGAEFRKWKQIPYIKGPRGVYRLGPVRFYHGFDAGVNSDELECLQMVGAIKDQAYSLWVRGHTHRPSPGVLQCKRTQKILLPWWYANAGTMGPLKPDYTKRKDTVQWGHAIIKGECSLGSPRRPSFSDWDADVEKFETT